MEQKKLKSTCKKPNRSNKEDRKRAIKRISNQNSFKMKKKDFENTLKKLLCNQIIKKGGKHLVEKAINKSFKQHQKQKKKNTNRVIKISILTMMPTFKTIKLTNKRRRKKSLKLIPTFLPNNKYRSSWGLKNLIKFSTQEESFPATLPYKLLNGFLLTTKLENKNVELKKKQQSEALKEKKYFQYYRW